jgi:predicted nucleic acid-binding protein
MKSFFDTSVLVAAAWVNHQHHDRSVAAFAAVNKQTGCCAAHTLAEVYSALTGIPGKQRMNGSQALLILNDIEEKLEIVSLTATEYRKAIDAAAGRGVVGGTIYDALLGQSAVKGGATRILTWDIGDFRRLGPENAAKVQTP